jgi:transcriptional regulator with XRE-family HTH domain
MKFKQKQEKARILFLNSNLTQKGIAENVGVTENTISSWIEKFGWRDLKTATTVTKDEVIKMTWRQIADITQKANDEKRTQTPAETDQILKLSKVIKEAEGVINAPIVMQVFIDFDKFLINKLSELKGAKGTEGIEFVKKVNEFQDLYITNLLNDNT